MITIKLEIASNGVIKTVTDNNYNGAGSNHEKRTVYETENDEEFNNTVRFLYDLSDDLGIDLGNKFNKNVLNFELGWGDKYEPTYDEVKRLVKETSKNLKELRQWEKELKAKTVIEDIIAVNKGDSDLPF
jgi:hypothetical protein